MTYYPLAAVLLGDKGVGKHSIIYNYTREIPENYDPTLEDMDFKHLVIDGQREIIQLSSISHEYTVTYPGFLELVLQRAEGFLLVYDISSASSLETIKQIYEGLRKERNRRPISIVGNKRDKQKEREVTTEMGRQLAESWHCDFAEISSGKEGGSEEVFFNFSRQIQQMRKRNEAREARRLPLKPMAVETNERQHHSGIQSTFDRFWKNTVSCFLGHGHHVKFEPIPGLEAFQSPPISSVSSFSLPEKWAVWRNRSSATLKKFDQEILGKTRNNI